MSRAVGGRWLGAAVLGAAAAVATRRAIVRRSWRLGRERGEAEGRWHAVTVNQPLEEVSKPVGQPAPLERLGPGVEIRYRRAPGGRGTEVAVRATHEGPAEQRAIRSALREAKQLWEIGEVLRPDEPGTAQRTVLNRPLEYAIRHAREDGRL